MELIFDSLRSAVFSSDFKNYLESIIDFEFLSDKVKLSKKERRKKKVTKEYVNICQGFDDLGKRCKNKVDVNYNINSIISSYTGIKITKYECCMFCKRHSTEISKKIFDFIKFQIQVKMFENVSESFFLETSQVPTDTWTTHKISTKIEKMMSV